MPYFQSVFNTEFLGVYVITDRQYSTTFKVGPNRNTSTLMVNYNDGPFDLSTYNVLSIAYSMNSGSFYNTLSVTLTAASGRTAGQIVTELNANATFAAMFTATASANDKRISIRSNHAYPESFRAYVVNSSAERILGFNLKAPVVELPSFFSRNVIGTEAGSSLVLLTQPTDDWVITNAGLSTTPQADYQFLRGRSGYFTFVKNVVDGSSRITSSIEYPAGALAGDLARKTTYSYTAANTNPTTSAQVPYTLQSGDLITPP